MKEGCDEFGTTDFSENVGLELVVGVFEKGEAGLAAEPWADVGFEVVRGAILEVIDEIFFAIGGVFKEINCFEMLVVAFVGVDCEVGDNGIFRKEFGDIDRTKGALKQAVSEEDEESGQDYGGANGEFLAVLFEDFFEVGTRFCFDNWRLNCFYGLRLGFFAFFFLSFFFYNFANDFFGVAFAAHWKFLFARK